MPQYASDIIKKTKYSDHSGKTISELTEGTLIGAGIGAAVGFMIGYYHNYNKLYSLFIGMMAGGLVSRVFMVKR